ncbi:MAG: HNH endonuclease signature motif containing protein [Gulosibacter sp.]|uniref:HNH endonuclease signature motif containing protein n=1 Tax=Gulosibacter sp. TaxID=2817531 RepID=UPI003F93C029
MSTTDSSVPEPSLGPRIADVRDRFAQSHRAIGLAESIKLRALAEAYEIAEVQAQASMSSAQSGPRTLKTLDKFFAWHLRSLMGELSFVSREVDITLRNYAYDAHALVTRFPDWVEAIAQAKIEVRHARAMLRGARALDDEQAQLLGETCLHYAASHSVSKTAQFVERKVAKLAANEFEESNARERAERSVYVKPAQCGMAHLIAYLPIEQAVAIDQLLTLEARTLRDDNLREAEAFKRSRRAAELAQKTALSGDEPVEPVEQAFPEGFEPDDRTTAQIRADVFAETLLCATPESILASETEGAARIKATVNVTVPALSLLNRTAEESDPALLNGTMPMSFAEAKQFAATAPTLQRILTHPITGHTVSVDTYMPDKSLRRFLQVRDVTCRFPGCARPAQGSDLDHTVPYADGGETCDGNLAHLCRPHHVQKHERGWSVRQVGRGVLEFTTPLGYQAQTEPEPIGPRFRPVGEPIETDSEKNSGSVSKTGPSEDPDLEPPPF